MDKWQGSGRGGSGVSEVARPTSLILAKANAEVMKTVQMPLRPLANAPGLLPIDNMLCILCMLAWWSIDQWCMQVVIVLILIIVWLGTCILSRVVTGVIVKLKYAQRERTRCRDPVPKCQVLCHISIPHSFFIHSHY